MSASTHDICGIGICSFTIFCPSPSRTCCRAPHVHNTGTSRVGLKVSILVVLLEDLCTIQLVECLCHPYISSVMTSYFQISCGYDTAQYIQNTVYTYVPSVQREQSLKERIHDPDVLQPCTSSTGSSHHPCNTD